MIYLLIFILIPAGKFFTTNNPSFYEYKMQKIQNYNLLMCVSFFFL